MENNIRKLRIIALMLFLAPTISLIGSLLINNYLASFQFSHESNYNFKENGLDILNNLNKMTFIGQIGAICVARNNEYLNQFQTSEMLKWSLEYFLETHTGNADETIKRT